jgi:chemotaxis signal transduction protein
MKGPPAEADVTAAGLRQQFDQSFAAPPPTRLAAAENLLAIGLAGRPHALWVPDIAGLFKDRRVTPLPGPVLDFIGVAVLRGRLVPVYDLRGLLGYASSGSARWLVLVRAPEPLALAFDSFEGQFAAPREASGAGSSGRARHVVQVVSGAEILRPVVDVASVVETVRSRAAQREPAKER